ncbi:MAG: ABC transporter ATP-binding protein, partial [Clostridiales Family XIII bacterium]|nr:ABC transporter ATP-binding protein [Clostridiales Family XIII bacterium]
MISLSVKNLRVRIHDNDILHGLDLTLDSNERVGIVGESGSGKTIFVKSLMGLLPMGASGTGQLEINEKPFDLNAKERAWRRVRGAEIGMVMQDPFTALNPLKKCGAQILEGVSKDQKHGFHIEEALAEVGLPEKIKNQYPFELSGGMQQRVVIASALATQPKILIADEATTALDVITQKEILDLIEEIRTKRGMPLILITHDIRLVYERTNRLIVVRDGNIVESGLTKEVIDNPQQDYTKQLVYAGDNIIVKDPIMDVDTRPLLIVTDITKRFKDFTAVDHVNIQVHPGEFVGVVGESGSGKTTLGRMIVGLTVPNEGSVAYYGNAPAQIVFQDPYSSLNPAHTVRYTLEEALKVSGNSVSELGELLHLAEIPESLLDRKPVGLSGGQRQRVAIARALAPRPDLLVCDESVSALDILTRNQILQTIERLRRERGLAILFITHDLSIVRMLASRIYVMHQAKIVEEGSVEDIFHNTSDLYTR